MEKILLLLILPLALSGCSTSATMKNESVRAANCALIADWNVHSNDPASELYQGKLNTYETESEKEDRLWLKLQSGDQSYNALLELRKLNYAQHYWSAPPIGVKVTIENADTFRVKEDLFDDETSWKIIESVRESCPSFPKEYLAEMFSAALLIKG